MGLMAKPMLVTMPLVLLLLDYWPLGRMAGRGERGEGEQRQGRQETGRRGMLLRTVIRSFSLSPCLLESRSCSFSALFVEKIPLLAVVAASSAVTYLAAGEAGAVETHSLPWRAAYALVSYVVYLGRFLSGGLDRLVPAAGRRFAGAVTRLAAHRGVAAIGRHHGGVVAAQQARPYLAVGWLWYFGDPAAGHWPGKVRIWRST